MKDFYIALDYSTIEECEEFIRSHPDHKYYKVGLEICSRYGVENVLKTLERYGVKIFLDLKLHDIPQTVSKTLTNITEQSFELVTIHLSGGGEMIDWALEAVGDRVVGVAVLTSLSDLQSIQIFGKKTESKILELVELGYSRGVRKFVCSPLESQTIKQRYPDVELYCPGISIGNVIQKDQQRKVSFVDACNLQIDYGVIGRGITQNPDIKIISKLKSQITR